MQCDFLIVGAGLSAGPVIEHLARNASRARVVVLERGMRADAPDERWIRLVRGARTTTIKQWWTSGLPGGAANLWYGQLSRFKAADFRTVPEEAAAPSALWSVGEVALTPYYDEIERSLRPYCADHLLRESSKPAQPCLVTARSRTSTFERVAFDVLVKEGWAPYCGATCLGGHGWSAAPVDPVSLSDLQLSSPAAHERNWAFRNASTVARSDNICILEGVQAVRLQPCSGGHRVFARNKAGGETVIVARSVFLAGGVTSTVPLLHTVPDVNKDRLGRDFTMTSELTAYVQTEIPRTLERDQRIGRFANISSRHLSAPSLHDALMGGKISFYDARSFEGDRRHEAKLKSLLEGKGMNSRISPDRVVLKLSFKGTSQTSSGKRIEVDGNGEPILHYEPTARDVGLIESVETAIRNLAEAFPGGRVLGVTDNVRGDDITSAHLHGGAVFDTDRETGVLTTDCEVRGAPGIFVVDASFMPGSGGTNSSHTVLANAVRVVRDIWPDLR